MVILLECVWCWYWHGMFLHAASQHARRTLSIVSYSIIFALQICIPIYNTYNSFERRWAAATWNETNIARNLLKHFYLLKWSIELTSQTPVNICIYIYVLILLISIACNQSQYININTDRCIVASQCVLYAGCVRVVGECICNVPIN